MQDCCEIKSHRRPQYVLVFEVPALILLSYVSLLALSVLDNIRGPFYPEILKDLAVSATSGSFFFATVSMFAMAGNYSSHFLLRYQSSVRLLAWGSLVLAAGFTLIATVPHMPTMLIPCAIFGFAFGILNVVQNVLLYEAAKPAHRRRLFNGLHAMYALASVTAPLTASALRDAGYGWRPSFMMVAFFPAAVGAWALFFKSPDGHRPPKDKPRFTMDNTDRLHCAFYALAMAFYLWGELSISTRMPLWLRTERGFSADNADLYLAGFFTALLGGRILFSLLHLRQFSNWTVLAASAGTSALVYFLGLNWDPRFLVLAGFTMAPFYPMLMDQAGVRFEQKSSQALGFIIAGGSVSLVFMHVIIGIITDHAGLTTALSICAGLFILLTLGLLARTVGGSRPSS